MKKFNKTHLILLSLSLVLIIGFNTKIHSQKSNIETMKLNGEIRSLRKATYNVIEKNGDVHKGKISENIKTKYSLFNEDGEKIEEIEYDNSTYSKISNIKITYSYDEKGYQTEINNYYSKDTTDWKFSQKHIFKYDNDKNLIEEGDYFSDSIGIGITNKFTYKYDDKGNKIEQDYSCADFSDKYTYVYDDKGNIVEENNSTYSGGGDSNMTKRTYKYDNKGYMIEEKYFINNELSEKKTIKYADNGNKTFEKWYDDKGLKLGRNKFKYNDNWKLVEENLFSIMYGGLTSKITYKYGDNGNLIEVTKKKSVGLSLGEKSTYKYYYDKSNNWIKEIIYINTTPVSITERTIIYYD